MTNERLEPGTTLGRYEIKEFLGRGSQADVYRAYLPSLHCDRALKVLHPQWALDATFLERFRDEAKRTAGLEHPNIVTVHDYGEENGHTWIAMSLVKGGALDDVLADRGSLPIDDVLDLMWQVASGLDFAHARGIIHRDVKPGNVLVDDDKGALLTDFGIARAMEGDPHRTEPGSFVGTAHYMSPEQCQGQELSGRSDLYSLAVMLFQLVTGKLPFDGKNWNAVALKHLQDPPEWPEEAAQDLGEEVVRAIERGLSKSAADRPETCVAFIRGVDEALRGCEDSDLVPIPPRPDEERPGAKFYSSAVSAGALAGALLFFGVTTSKTAAAESDLAHVDPGPDDPEDPKDRDGLPVPPIDPPQDEPTGPIGPPPVWPDADATTPAWVGPTRAAILLDGSALQWDVHGAPKVLRDACGGPLRQALEADDWRSVRPRVDLPEGAFDGSSAWFDALGSASADVVVLLGIKDVDQDTIPGGGFKSDRYEASMVLIAHVVDVAAGTLAVDSREISAKSSAPADRFVDAFREAVTSSVESLLDGVHGDVHAWRESARDRGQSYDVAVFGAPLENGLHTWMNNALRDAPGGVADDFSSVGQWPFDPEQSARELVSGLVVRMREGQSWAHWRISYRGELADLEEYMNEGLGRYLAWSGVSGGAMVRTQGSWLVFELP